MTEPRHHDDERALPARLWSLPTLLLALIAPRSQQIVLEAFGGDVRARVDFALLAGLEEYGPLSQAALARRTGFDRSDLVEPLRDLERRGLARRRPDPRDRRRHAVTITAKGTRQLRALDARASAAQAELLAPLNGAERRELAGLLQRLVVHHTEFTPPPT